MLPDRGYRQKYVREYQSPHELEYVSPASVVTSARHPGRELLEPGNDGHI